MKTTRDFHLLLAASIALAIALAAILRLTGLLP